MNMAPADYKKEPERTEGHRYRLPLGSSVAGFRIMRSLGVNDLGEVYLAENTETRERRALRILPEEIAARPEVLKLLQGAVRLREKLNHVNIRCFRETGTDGDSTYVTMDYIEGPRGEDRSLLEELRDAGGRIRDERKVRGLALQICDALEHAHREGVIHGHLHPSDILIGMGMGGMRWKFGHVVESKSGHEDLLVKISDFGMTALREQLPTGLKIDAYSSPEERAGHITVQTDMYAFGVILYQMLTGGRPGSTLVPPSRYGVARVWDPIVERCLEPDPANRYPSAAALRLDLEKAVSHRSLRRALAAAALVALGSLAAWQGYVVWQKVSAALERRAEDRRLVEQRKTEAAALVREARDAFQLRKFPEADALMRRALDLVPDQPEALALQEEIVKAGDQARAEVMRIEGLQKLDKLRANLAIDPQKAALEKAEAAYALATRYLEALDYAAARESFREAMAECDRGLKMGEERQGALRQKQRAEQARWNAKKHSAELDAAEAWASAEGLFHLAAGAFEDNRFDEAVRTWQSAIQTYGQAEQTGLAAIRVRAEEARSAQAQEEERRARLRWPRLPDGYRVIGPEVDEVSDLPRIIEHKRTGYRLILIPAGSFILGSSANTGAEDERPARRIELSEYWIGESEVTVEQYAKFLIENGNQTEAGVVWVNLGPAVKLSSVEGQFMPDSGYEEHPMVEVSWYGARAFAESIGGDLPTEAQWEKAAKGGRETRWPWGDRWDNTKANTAERIAAIREFRNYAEWLAWWEPFQRQVLTRGKKAYLETTRPVRSYEPNNYGLHDMAGNVLEWCLDYYVPDAYRKLKDGQKDPPPVPQGSMETVTYWRGGEKIEETSECRVVRGGSWGYMGSYARCAFRFRALSAGRYSDGGFRVVVPPKALPSANPAFP